MRRALLLLLLLLVSVPVAPRPARAVVFYGREGWQFQGQLNLQWSTDLGNPPPPVWFPPCPGTVTDTSVSVVDSTFIAGGRVGATMTHHIAPAGVLTPAIPFATYDLHTWSSNPGSYGRFVGALDNGNFYLDPAVMGESLAVIVHWKVTASGPPGSWSWSEQMGGVIADQSSGAEGYAVKILQGPDSRYYVFRSTFSGSGGIGASNVGTQDMVLHVDLSASDARVLAVPGATTPAALALSAPAPNPVRESATFAVELAQRSGVRLAITDVTGRAVRTLELGTLDAGRHAVRWDRTDDGGARVAPGVYWARVIQSDGRSAGRRVVVLD